MSAIALCLRGLLGFLLPEWLGRRLVAAMTRRLKKELLGQATDKLVETLLAGMAIAFVLLPSYRRQLRNYQARIVFRSAQGPVAAAATFQHDALLVERNPEGPGDCQVTFTSPVAFMRFLFAKDHDVFESMLKNEVTVEGNCNHVYRFGFLANELVYLLGFASE